MKTLAASLSILTREGVMLYLLRGVAFTCIISVLGVIMGLIVAFVVVAVIMPIYQSYSTIGQSSSTY